jgi:hypothetical protein
VDASIISINSATSDLSIRKQLQDREDEYDAAFGVATDSVHRAVRTRFSENNFSLKPEKDFGWDGRRTAVFGKS